MSDVREWRPNWLKVNDDLYVRVEPVVKLDEHGALSSLAVRPLAIVRRTSQGGGWWARLEYPADDHIEFHRLEDTLREVDRLLEERYPIVAREDET
jgi:hypothetical protein